MFLKHLYEHKVLTNSIQNSFKHQSSNRIQISKLCLKISNEFQELRAYNNIISRELNTRSYREISQYFTNEQTVINFSSLHAYFFSFNFIYFKFHLLLVISKASALDYCYLNYNLVCIVFGFDFCLVFTLHWVVAIVKSYTFH